MTLTPAQIDALDTYTNAQMVKMLRYAQVQLVSAGPEGSVAVAGRTWTMKDMRELESVLASYEKRAADDADASALETTGCPVVTYQEPQV
jgi:hypothetical protein